MPGRDVFDVLDERARRAPDVMPAVIFTTAYHRYAVRAFELNAADYLVKPLTAARFGQAMTRARARMTDRASVAEGIARVARDLGRRPDRLLVPERGRMVPIAVDSIGRRRSRGSQGRWGDNLKRSPAAVRSGAVLFGTARHSMPPVRSCAWRISRSLNSMT